MQSSALRLWLARKAMRFALTVYRPAGGFSTLILDAADEASARHEASRAGWGVLSVELVRGRRGQLAGARFDVVLFGQELLALVEAGMSLVEAIELLTARAKAASTRSVLQALHDGIGRGLSVSAAMESRPDAFPVLFVATVRASERTGSLIEGVRSYLAYRRSLDALRAKLVSASIYPFMLLVVGVLVVAFLLTYVVPRFAGVYASLDPAQLPLMSRALMEWGQLFAAHRGALLAGVAVVVTAAAVALLRPSARAAFERALWRVPHVGERLRVYQLARFTRTLALLLEGGTPLPAALGLTSSLLRQPALQASLASARQAIEEGRGVAEAFRDNALATDVGARLLSVGERSGSLHQTMTRIATFYDDENARRLDLLTRVFEPALMVTMGLVIGGIVVLMYLPIFQLASSIQ